MKLEESKYGKKAIERTMRGSLEAPIDILRAFKLLEKPLQAILIYRRRRVDACR